jgi:Amt family ammonium transporter
MLLWFGWFRFNAGSQIAADGVAVNAFLITNTAGAMGAIAWMLCEWFISKRPTMLGIVSGAIAGLATITPASGYVNLSGGLAIGLCAGILGFVCVTYLKKALKYDDSLDAFGVHGIGGIFGSLAVGFFADPAVNSAKGLFYGNPLQAWIQLKAVLITILYSGVATAIVYYISAFITKGGRVKDEVEQEGLDEAVHGEKGFYL